jgi:hypothetical protein
MTTLSAIVVFSFLVSAAGLFGVARYYRAAKASSHWPCVPGKLLSYELLERCEEGKDVYSLEIKYSYQVDDKVFESSNIMYYLPKWSQSRSKYVQLRDRVTAEKELSVLVNPDRHAESVLFPGTDQLPAGMLPLACFMIVVCPISGMVAFYGLFLR